MEEPDGAPAVRPDRTTWQVSITVEDKEWLRRRAAEEGVTMAGLLHMMIRRERGERALQKEERSR